MVVDLLAFLKTKSPNMVVVLLEFLSNMTHVLVESCYFIKMRKKAPRITRINKHTGGKIAPLIKIS